MTLLVEAYLWCVLQVTLLAFFSVAVYLLIARRESGLSVTVLLGSLGLVGALTLFALVPGPRWSWQWFSESQLPQAEAAPLEATDAFPEDVSVDAVASPITPPTSANSAVDVFTEPEQPQRPADDNRLANPLPVTHAALPSVKSTDESRAADGFTIRTLPWKAVVAALASLAVAAGVLRMIVALTALRSFRRSGVPVNEESVNRSLAEICQRLGLRKLPQLRESRAVATPATIGWWSPLVLLPPDWREWSPEERSAVLAHELAHVRLRHFAKWLFAQWVLLPHYYHPLVHWLVGRLRVEQELAADQHAARALGDHQLYAAALAALALRPAVAPPRGATLGLFMSHSLLTRRIKMLGNPSPQAANTRRIRLVLLLVLLACGVGVSGIRDNRVVAQEQDASKPVEVVVEDVAVEVAEILADAEVAVDVQVDEVESAADEAAEAENTENRAADATLDAGTRELQAELNGIRAEFEQYLHQIAELEAQHAKKARSSGNQVSAAVAKALEAQARALVVQLNRISRQLAKEQQRVEELKHARREAELERERARSQYRSSAKADRGADSERPTYQVTALMRVHHDDHSTLQVARATQLALLKSDVVLQAAVQNHHVQELNVISSHEDPHAWLRSHLDVGFIDDSEILQIRLLCSSGQVEECRRIVDAVAQAYLEAVVTPTHVQRLRERDHLRQALARLNEEIRRKMEDYQDLARELGARDGESNVEQELNLRRMDRLETEIMRLENEALLHEMRDDDSEEAEIKEKFYAARMDQLRQQRAELEEAMRARGEPSVDLKLRQAELQQLQEMARQVGMQIEQTDIQMHQAPQAVQAIQPATASRITGQERRHRGPGGGTP